MLISLLPRSLRGSRRARSRNAGSRRLRLVGETLECRALMSGTTNPFDTPEFQKAFKKLLSEQTKQSGVVASIAFIHDGQTLTYGSPGTSPDSLFRIASVSKTFTAAAIMLLVQDGKLNLDDSAVPTARLCTWPARYRV